MASHRLGIGGAGLTPPTFVELLRRRGESQPDEWAFDLLLDGETVEATLTYGEVDRQARAIGALLQGYGASGERILLLYPPGLEFITAFFGCLYAGGIAVPVYPPNPARLERTLPMLKAIIGDAQPSMALTTSRLLHWIEPLLAEAPDIQAVRWLATDDVSTDLAEEWRDPALGGNTHALLQYTSGSTASPKGVMVTHGNLLHNSAFINQCCKVTPNSHGVMWLPPYHDMGLIGGILQPLYSGRPVTMMSPIAFLQRPLRWLQAISRTRASVSGGPNFAYELCVRKIGPEQRATLDLSSWDVAFNGAEPIRHDTLERFARAFEPCGFRREAFHHCYGLAEATLIVSGGGGGALPVVQRFEMAALERNQVVEASAESDTVRTLVGCGKTLPDQKIIIVDPDSLAPCPPDRVGEVWVSGPSIAQGYWNRLEETEHTFQAYLADGGEGPFLRTGDLGFLKDGELFITGRLKDLLIIRGRNHYPQDIELTVERSHPALRPGCGAAFLVEMAGEERLVVVQEVDRRCRNPDLKEMIRAVRHAVAENHELQLYNVALVKAGSIPKTSSGKIQRHAARASFLSGNLDVLDGQSETQNWRDSGSPSVSATFER